MADREMKWWGWGDPAKTYSLQHRPRVLPFLSAALGLEGTESFPRASLDAIHLDAPRIDDVTLGELQGILGASNVSTDKRIRLVHAMGKSYRDIVRIRQGMVPNAPDVVVFPAEDGQVQRVLELAAQNDLAVIPFGGGTSVVGGVEPIRGARLKGALSLDLRRMNRVLGIDSISSVAVAQPGILGPDLERRLNDAGFTLGYFPQSFEYSTLGGWVATRGAGQKSTKYGKIEDLVEALRVVAPKGILETRAVPASASGPDLQRFLVGSEGMYGVITEITVRIQPRPESTDFRGAVFRRFEDGLDAVRGIIQAGLRPPAVRLSDSEETQAILALGRSPRGHGKSMVVRVRRALASLRGVDLSRDCLMILGFEGHRNEVRRERRQAVRICKLHRGKVVGRIVRPGRSWFTNQFELPYLRDVLIDRGIMIDTLETSVRWNRVREMHTGVKAAILEAIERQGVRGLAMCYVSHAYPDGAALYFTFMAKMVRGREIEQWTEAKRAASNAILRLGGTISHHHGVGIDHAEWITQEHGTAGIEVLRAVKRELDPKGIMNPGKLFDWSG